MRVPLVVPVVALALAALGLAPATAAPAPAEQARATTVAPKPRTATTIGQLGTGDCGVNGPAAVVISTEGAGTPTYVAPFKGVVVSFSHQANSHAGQVQAIVFADTATATTKTVVAKSPKQTVAVNQLNTFATRLPMKAGQRLGLGFSAKDMACATAAGFAGDQTLVKSPFDADTAGVFVADGVLSAAPGVTFRPNISAVLEPDVDGDGYGDITQDGCTQSAHVIVPCPDTKITKRPKHKATRTKVKIKVEFTASIAGSTFQCRLDGHHKWKRCSSPYHRRLGVGRHRLQVRAVSPAGVPDPKPAKVRFSIRRK